MSPRLVRSARSVRREGVPELVRAVEKGELTVGRAETLAKAPAERQRRVLERLDDATNQAEKKAVFSGVGAADGEAGGEVEELDLEAVARDTARRRCMRRLAGLLRDAEDPEREFAEACAELAQLVGVADAGR